MRNFVLSILFVSFLSLFVSAEEAADDSNKEESYTETVVVTADRFEEPLKDVGSSVTVISAEEIEQRKAPFVLDLLRTVPGVYISHSGSTGKITSIFTRGAGSDQTLVMIDGVQINDSIGFIDLAHLTTTNIERIEVVRGPQSTLYGSDALGGVVNILTSHAGPLLTARGEAGSDSTFNAGVRTGIGSQKNNFTLEYSRYTTDGETDNDDYDNETVVANAHVQVTDWTNLGFLYRNADADLGIPFLSGIPTPDQRQRTTSSLVHVPLRQEIQDWWNAEAHFSVFDQELHFQHPDSPFGFTFSDTDSRTTTFNLLNTLSVAEGQILLGGYEYEKIRVDDESNFGVNLENAEVTNNAVYGQYQISVWEPLTLTFGLRVDDHSKFGTDTNPRLAVSYSVIHTLRIRGTVGSGFRAPRPFELGGPFGNTQLQPEEVTGWDLGADYDVLPNILSVSGTVFRNDFDQLIGFDLNTFRFANFQKVQTSGFEFELDVRPLLGLDIRGTYTYLKTEDKVSGNELLRRPQNSGGINVDYRWKGLTANFNWNLVGARFDIDDAVFPPARIVNDGYNRADAVVGYDLTDGIQIYMRFTNLFDQEYQEVFGFPSPDRGVFTGIKLAI